eukprot:1357853-Amorphochlora_amoeboformis.AAC.1
MRGMLSKSGEFISRENIIHVWGVENAGKPAEIIAAICSENVVPLSLSFLLLCIGFWAAVTA